MPYIDRRTFVKILGLGGAAAGAGAFGFMSSRNAYAQLGVDENFYKLPMKGDARILHVTDVHAQLRPVYFREPNVNLGMGKAFGRPPHIVGTKLLEKVGMSSDPDGIEAYAYTYLNFEKNARKYGRMGGFAHIRTLLNMLREQAGGLDNTITLDGGDTWQGSATALWTRGVDMVEAANILGINVMVGHWEFTYREDEVLKNVAIFKGDFIGQNVRVKDESMMDDKYTALVEKFNGSGLFDEDSGHAFQPYVIKTVGGRRIAVVGQAFPRTGNANPPEFFPDWSFGIREDDMRSLVKKIRTDEKPDAVVLVSHNGMDVDIKMGETVPGFDAIFGGHTHDGVPVPIKVKDQEGGICHVTNAGSNGKYLGVMDFEFEGEKLKDLHYKMMPVFEKLLPADKEMTAYIDQMRSSVYDEKIVESRDPKRFFSGARKGKTFKAILDEKLAIADRTLYRRGNFMGTWDQVICNALREEYGAHVAMSAGVRWGTTTLKGDWITMEDVMTQCALTYGETYVAEMTGKQLLEVLEAVADNLFDPDPFLQSGGDMVRVGGMDYTIEPSKGLYKRITDVRLDDGSPIEPGKKYKVAGWAVVDRTPDGPLIWDVVREYILKSRGKDNVLKLAKINHPKLVGVLKDPGIADYPGEAS